MNPTTLIFTAINLGFVLFGLAAFGYALKRWWHHLRGVPQVTVSGQSIPVVVWPLCAIFAIGCLAAGLPGLLGRPMWVLEHLFSLIAN